MNNTIATLTLTIPLGLLLAGCLVPAESTGEQVGEAEYELYCDKADGCTGTDFGSCNIYNCNGTINPFGECEDQLCNVCKDGNKRYTRDWRDNGKHKEKCKPESKPAPSIDEPANPGGDIVGP